jgi:hypothetical protein
VQTVQTSNAEVASTVTNEQVRRLPLLDRDPMVLISTQAGVSSNADDVVINGTRSSFSNVTLDGINIQDNFIRTGGLNYQPNLLLMDQVSEFTIVSSNGNATLGGGASQVNLVTPSGTNQLHGKAYWYNRNNYFAANYWFDDQDGNPRPFLNQNQVGASIGGPIKRDKLFFYFNYEAVRTRQQSEVDATILTAAARQGIFSYFDTRTGKLTQVNILTLMGLKADPTMAALLAKVPGPDKINNFRTGDSRPGLLLNTAGYGFNQQSNRDRNNITGRIDYTLSPKHNFSATYAYNNDHLDRGDAATNFDQVPAIYNDDAAKLLSLGWRWNPIPSMTNELRGGFNLAPAIFATRTAYPSAFIDGTAWSNPINEFLPQGRFTNTFHINDGATWVHGRHTFQFGFQSQRVRVNVYDFGGTTPDYVVSTGTGHAGLTSRQLTNISQADLDNANVLLASLAGLVDSGSQLYNVTSQSSGYVAGAPFRRHYALSNYSGYVLDTWKAWPKFTITLGLRYEYFTPTSEQDSLGLAPVLENNNPIVTLLDPNGKLNFTGNGSNPFYTPSKTNFAPNVGFAWDIFGNGKTALRGGYSMHYVNDEAIRAVDNNTNTNSGLVGSNTIVGSRAFASNLPALAAPSFHVPISYAENYAADPTSALGLINPNLKTPYVQEYRISLQQKIKGTIIEASYVGNHGVQEIRAFDFNQVQINAKGFLADFLRAQRNGFLAQAANPAGGFVPTYNPNIPGSQQLTVFPLLRSGGSISGRAADPTVLAYLAEGQAAELATYYQINGLNGGVNFFQNYNSLGTNYLTNFSNSSYNALQINVSHRVDTGLYVQGNYTFSKVLSDADGNTQERFDPFLNVFNGSIERARAPFDITHVFHFNASYDLPVGKGQRFNTGRVLDRILGGWSVSSVLTYQSGAPFSILSGLGTLNRASSGRSRYNTATSVLGGDALDNIVQFQMTDNGPYNVVSSAIDAKNGGRGVAPFGDPAFSGEVFFNPNAGTVGALQRRMFQGPNVFNMDASLIKNTKITEHHTLEFRVDSFNVLNHPAFGASDQNVNSTTFGQIVSTVNDRRVVQFGLLYQF